MITWADLDSGWSGIKVGSEVSRQVYMDMLNILPPLSLKRSPYCGFQSGEPYSHEIDKEDGEWKSKHMTFVNVNGRYYYAGLQFRGECRWRLHR